MMRKMTDIFAPMISFYSFLDIDFEAISMDVNVNLKSTNVMTV